MITIQQLSDSDRRRLFDAALQPWTNTGIAPRREEMKTRLDIVHDVYDSEVWQRIYKTHKKAEVRQEMRLWAPPYFNIWKRIARKLAVAYKRRPGRRLEGGRDEDNALLADLYRRLTFNTRALRWQRQSIVMNRIIVIALPRRDEEGEQTIDFDVLTGADTEVWMPDDRPKTSMPDIAVQLLNGNPGDSTKPALRVIDSEAVTYWNSMGGQVGTPLPHGLGTFPGADILAEHDSCEFWDWTSWRAVTAGTLDAGMIGASMGWTRKSQCRNVLAMLTNAESSENTPDGQDLVDHEKPLILNGPNVQLVVHDLNTAVDGFIAHIKAIQDELAEQMTGSSSTLVDPDPKLEGAGVGGAAQHAAINEAREMQIASLERFERRMAFVLCSLGRGIGWDVPDPARIREEFRIDWPRLAFLDTPENRVRVWEEETKFGIADQVSALVERDGISEQEAIDRIREIAERRAELDAFRAARNQPADPNANPTTLPLDAAPGESLAQTQGRAGGSVDGDGQSTAPDPTAADAPGSAPAPKPEGDIPSVATTGDVQATALNGAQVKSLQDMALAVTSSQLPAEFMVRLLPVAFPGSIPDEAAARRIVEPLEGFKAPAPPTPPPFGGPPKTPPEGDPAPDEAAAAE